MRVTVMCISLPFGERQITSLTVTPLSMSSVSLLWSNVPVNMLNSSSSKINRMVWVLAISSMTCF